MNSRTTRRRFVQFSGGVALFGVVAPAVARSATQASLTYLDFVTPNDGTPRGDALGRNLAAFAEAHPDIKIEVQTVPSAEIPQHLLRSAAAGRSPDVAKVHLPDLSAQVDAGTIEPLDSYVSGWDKEDWLLNWNSTVIGGHKMAIPWDYRPNVLLYRKSILADDGVAVPTTWAEVLAGAKKIGADNPTGFAVGLSKSSNADTLAEFFCCAVISAGGQIFNADGTAAVNSEVGVTAFQWLKDLFDEGGTSRAAVGWVYNSLGDGLAAGTLAMALLGSQRVRATAAKVAGDDIGFAAPPGWDASRPGQSNALSQTLVLGKTSENKEAAVQFIEFMTGPKAAVEVAKGGEVPPRKSSYDAPFFSTPEAELFNKLKNILLDRPGYVPYYPVRYWDLKQALAEAAQSMVLQEKSPQEVLDTAAAQYNTLIGK